MPLIRVFLVFTSLWGGFHSPSWGQGFPDDAQGVVQVETLLSFDKVHPGSQLKIAVIAHISPGWHINSNLPLDEFLIPTDLQWEDDPYVKILDTFYPESVLKSFSFTTQEMAIYEGKAVIGILTEIDKKTPSGLRKLSGHLTYQTCDDKQCLAPVSLKFSVPLEMVGFEVPVNLLHAEVFSKMIFKSSPGESGDTGGGLGDLIRGKGLFLAFILIFVGGLALNLTPCVYPLIPITVSYFGGQAGGRIGKMFSLALIYVLGMAITYSVLGVIAALTGGLLGAALQNSLVLTFIALVLVALSLSMFGLYEIRVPAALVRISGGAKGGYGGALFMGLTVGIIAAPCIGPFVLGLFLYVGETANPLLGFWMFFVLALGLGVPFILLGTLSGNIHRLPRSGEWMVWVRKIFGFVLVGMAFYFLRTLFPRWVYWLGMGLLAVVAGVYLGFIDRTGKKAILFPKVKLTVGILFLLLALWLLGTPGHLFLAKAQKPGPQWQPYSDVLIQQAQQQGKPVVIDFYADWCIPCQELDYVTFSDARVVERMKGVLPLKADFTHPLEPLVQKLREEYGIVGVPTIVFLNRWGEEIPGIRVAGFIKAGSFLERLETLLIE